jgi:hypothetical protein
MDGHNESFEIWVNSDQPMPSDVETVMGNGLQVTGVKFMEDGKLFIRVGERVYDMIGNVIK